MRTDILGVVRVSICYKNIYKIALPIQIDMAMAIFEVSSLKNQDGEGSIHPLISSAPLAGVGKLTTP